MRKLLLILVPLLVIIGGGALFWNSQPDLIAIVKPMRGKAVQAVYATGTVEPSVMIPIAPRSTVRLLALRMDEGMSVKKGDVLAQFDDSDLLKSEEQAKAALVMAEREYKRKMTLLKSGAISQRAIDQAETDLQAASANAQRIAAELEFLKLKAPEDGLIIRRDGEVGEIVQTNEPVFWMSCCAPLRIAAEVDEEDIAVVKVGQKVVISADAFPGKIFNGKVSAITPKGDPVARSYRVRIMPDEATPLMVGMTAETNILIHENDNALLVPASAVSSSKVLVMGEDMNLAERPVSLGARSNDAAEIVQGLEEMESIAADYHLALPHAGKSVPVRLLSGWSPDQGK